MAHLAYMTLQGQKQGAIKGNVTQKGREGWIALLGFAYAIETPLDAASGLPSGKRQHKPVVIRKEIDEASPKLFEAMVTNETLTSVKIEFWRPYPEIVSPYFFVLLTNAQITGVALTPSDGEDAHEIEQIQFVYQRIEVTWVPGGESAQDDWTASG
ncbi:MAG: type VI secretion system tube protein TssD [Acetobacteraceae bacterium]|jgi:type VI secretion system secreted protein Hcp